MLSRAASVTMRQLAAGPQGAPFRHGRSLTMAAAAPVSSNATVFAQSRHRRAYDFSNRKRTYLGKASGVAAMPVKLVEVPSMGDSISEGTIVDLPVAPGDYVQPDDVVVVLETDKVSVDVRAPEAGAVVEILGEVDDVVEVGTGLFRIDTDAKPPDGEAPSTDKHKETTDADTAQSKSASKDTKKSPDEKKSADQKKSSSSDQKKPSASDEKKPSASDEKNKSSDDKDNKTALSGEKKPPPETKSSTDSAPYGSAIAFLGQRTERRTKMSRMRQRVAARLKDAQNTAAMLTTFQEVDMGNLMEMRSQYKEAFQEKHGVKLGFMSAFVKASTAALLELAAVNAYIDDKSQEIVYREYVDISIAVASPTGLVVPVLRNTETMSFADVERSIAMYGQKAKEGSLALDDMAGGTFTISNGGVFGSLMGTPIINPPQSAILGMHATKMRAVVNSKGEVVARPMMYLALTYDHRLIDGREGVTFLKSIAEKIADPSRLLLDI